MQHQGKEAEAQFERATNLDANSAEIHAAYGLFRLKRREYDKAAKQLDMALALDAKNPESLGNAARAYLGDNRFLDADRRTREALEKDPNNAHLIYLSGKVAETIGKLDEASKGSYEQALTQEARSRRGADRAGADRARQRRQGSRPRSARVGGEGTDRREERVRSGRTHRSLAGGRRPAKSEGRCGGGAGARSGRSLL